MLKRFFIVGRLVFRDSEDLVKAFDIFYILDDETNKYICIPFKSKKNAEKVCDFLNRLFGYNEDCEL